MKILCWCLIASTPVWAISPVAKAKEQPIGQPMGKMAPRAADPDAARLQGFSKGAQLVKPVGNPNSCTSSGTTYAKDDAGYAACVKAHETMEPAFSGKNPNNANPSDVIKVNPSSQNGFR